MLTYKTIANASPIGKPKVFFASEGKDIGYLTDVGRHINNYTSVAMYYDSDGDTRNITSEEICNMDLVVILLSREMLSTANDILNRVLPLALSNGIPVLPIGAESKVGTMFGVLCERNRLGKLDVLFPNSTDKTELSFTEKLNSFLEKKFGDKELFEEVIENFYGSIFLSYRKKDRETALAAMNLIASVKECREYSVWYDEFLTAGEVYDLEIQHYIDNCSVFLFLITENMICEDNYAIREELNRAIEVGKTIIMLDTITGEHSIPQKLLSCPNSIYLSDISRLPELLLKLLGQPSFEDETDALYHIYLLGLAFYHGYGTRKDKDYGLELVRYAADEGLINAIKSAVGLIPATASNLDDIAAYQQALVSFYEDEFNEEQTLSSLAVYLESLSVLGLRLNDLGNTAGCENCMHKILSVLDGISNWKEDIRLLKKAVIACDHLGQLTENHILPADMQEEIYPLLNKALYFYNLEYEYAELYRQLEDSMEADRYLYTPIMRITDLKYDRTNTPLPEIIRDYSAILSMMQDTYDKYPCDKTRADICECHKVLMEIYHTTDSREHALAHGEKMLEYARQNYLDNRLLRYLESYTTALESFSKLQAEYGLTGEAIYNLTKGIRARTEYLKEIETLEDDPLPCVRLLAGDCLGASSLYESIGEQERSQQYREQAYQLMSGYGIRN